MASEQYYQKRIQDKLEQEGWFVVKLIKTNKNAIPDLLATRRNECMFIEVKKENGVLSPLQYERILEIRNTGTTVHIWTDYETEFKMRSDFSQRDSDSAKCEDF